MKEKLTEMRALILCRRHWMWIKKHGKPTKSTYFRVMKMPEDEWPDCYCYACEYKDTVDDRRCSSDCIVAWDDDRTGGCNGAKDTPYRKWSEAFTEEDVRKVAGRILWRIEKSIKLLKEEQDAKKDSTSTC